MAVGLSDAKVMSDDRGTIRRIGHVPLRPSNHPMVLYQPPYSTTGGEFLGPFANWLNVKAFGAKGDGATDDTAALQEAINSLKPYRYSVIWIPAGTYLISSTLQVAPGSVGISIFGEDPETTTIRWAGQSGGSMLSINGSVWTRIGRITWDGASQASVGHQYTYDGIHGYEGTSESESDEIFVDLQYGVRIGWSAETSIERVRFIRNTAAGVSIEDWNALDIWIRDCTFTDSGIGVTNANLAGHFHVYNSLFQRSRIADMEMHNTSYFSERGNTSVGSTAFFVGLPVGHNPAAVTLQDNLVMNFGPQPIKVGNQGPMMMFDNVFVGDGSDQSSLVFANDCFPSDLLMVGNSFDRANVFSGNFGRIVSLDNATADHRKFDIRLNGPAPFQPRVTGTVIEVPPGSTTQQIQAALDQAAEISGTVPIVHLQAAMYGLKAPLQIKGGKEVRLVGDAGLGGSFLIWQGSGSGPMVKVGEPARARVSFIGFDGSWTAEALSAEMNDIPGSLARMSRVRTTGDAGVGVLVDGLDQTIVESLGGDLGGSTLGISAIGGPLSRDGTTVFGRVSTFGGTGFSHQSTEGTFSVDKGATLTVFDNWRDLGGRSPAFVNLDSHTGNLTLDAGVFGTPGPSPFSLNSFKGDVSLIGYEFMGTLATSGDGSGLRFTSIGNFHLNDCDFWNDMAVPSNNSLFLSMCVSQGSSPIPDVSTLTNDGLRASLSRVRNIRPQPLTKTPPLVSDLRLEGLFIKQTITGIHLLPAPEQSSSLAGYSIQDEGGNELVPTPYLSMEPRGSGPIWNMIRLNDGTHQMKAITTGKVLLSDMTTTSTAQPANWIIQPDGFGDFLFRLAGTNLILSRNEDGQPALLPNFPGAPHWILVPIS